MKFNNKIATLCAGMLALAASSCIDKEVDLQVFPSAAVDFTYNVDGDVYTNDYYVVSTIQFNNTSSKTGAVTWDFGDGSKSNEVNPKHKYAKSGTYKVTLSIDGVGSVSYPLMIFDIVPVITIKEQSTDIVEVNTTTIKFDIELPNPENLKVKYEWTFPEGTTDAEGNPMTTFVGYADENGNVEYPADVKFANIGTQKVLISTWFDVDRQGGENRQLEDSYINVQVGCNEPAATLYYAERNGNIKAYKLVDPASLPQGSKVYPFDLGVATGNMVFNLVYADVANSEGGTDGWIYMLDAGKQYYYVNDENGVLGDGQITAFRPDGTGVNVVITNVGGAAFNDPFQGFAVDGKLYYTDRNTGISAIDLTTRGAVEGQNTAHNRSNYFVVNNLIPWYGQGIAYGAIHTGIYRDAKGVWWWGKNYSGTDIYRFKESDIYPSQAEAEKAYPTYGFAKVLPGVKTRSFTIDEQRGFLYTWNLTTPEGLYQYPLPGDKESLTVNSFLARVQMDADPINTTDSEGVHTTQLALDKETGRIYFAFRPTKTDTSNIPAGIVYFDPNTKKVVHFGEGNDQATGICINPNKTKLFVE